VKTWDAIIAGGGIIGISLALELRKHGASVLIVERSQPGREASHAAAGMLADCDPQTPGPLQALATASAKLYPEFVGEIEDACGLRVDLRADGAIVFLGEEEAPACRPIAELSDDQLAQLEPSLAYKRQRAIFLEERSVDPAALLAAALEAAKHHGVEIASGTAVTEVKTIDGRVAGVATAKTHFFGAAVINCAGAWAGQIAPLEFPTRPMKGQMLSVAFPHRQLLRHVLRASDVYLVPRSDGRILIGTTVEDAGYDKRVDPEVIQRLHQAAANLVPEIGEARILEAWAGLRPGTPDGLPILGATQISGYFVARGHFRNGILLAPITAKLMAELVRGATPEFDLSAFLPSRFQR